MVRQNGLLERGCCLISKMLTLWFSEVGTKGIKIYCGIINSSHTWYLLTCVNYKKTARQKSSLVNLEKSITGARSVP